MALQKGGPSARKEGGHYLVFEGNAISKKSHCHREKHFLMYQNKVTAKKSSSIQGSPLLSVLVIFKKTPHLIKGPLFYFLANQKQLTLKKVFISGAATAKCSKSVCSLKKVIVSGEP